MKKFAIHIQWCIALLATACMLTSCLIDEFTDNSKSVYQGDGKEVNISFHFGSSQTTAVTKVLSDESERQVNDLMVFAFPIDRIDANGDPVFSTTRPIVKQYYPVDEIRATYAQEFHYNAGEIVLENVPTGTYALIGVANVKTSEYGAEALYEELQKVSSWEEYCNLRASLSTKGSIERVAPALLMSGSYRPADYEGDHRKLTPVEIRRAGYLSGYIHLVRVDARVKFVIKNLVNRVKSFKLETWQVFNVADDVKLYTNSQSTPQTTSNSIVFTQFTSRDTEHSFEFYIPEYIFTSTDNTLDKIRLREKRNDADDAWVYAPEDSPYVVFTGKIEMLVDDAETGTADVNRYADVKFTVHLGSCEGNTIEEKSKDFRTDRNTKYTYNIKIAGVEDIIIEAKRTPDIEYNHGSEGVIIDNVGGITYNFDSHYGIANIALSKNDLKKMSIQLSSVLGEQHFNRDNDGHVLSSNINTQTEDFQAFRFAFERESSVRAYQAYPAQIFRDKFVSYSKTYDAGKYIEVQHNEVSQAKDENHTFALYDLMSMLEGLPFGDGDAEYADQALIDHLNEAEEYRLSHPGDNQYASKDDIPIIFTMFVNENVYYKGVEDWHHHANSVDRVLRMFTTSDLSADGKSEYIRGRYNFDQKYCQTYYSDLNKEALCVEFVNEHHHKDIKNSKGVDAGAGGSVKSGWPYVNSELQGKRWDDCSDQTSPLCDHYNAFYTLAATNGVYAKQIPGSSDSNDYEAIYASLSRNRDLNRDGIIDSNELKWFLASMEQYIQITVGGAALERKVFVPDDYYNWNEAVDGPKGDIFNNPRFHFCGVETHAKFWAEEGYTIGNQWVNGAAESSSGYNSNPWELLCVRMLVDHSRVNEEEIHWSDFDDLYYFSDRERNVISMDMYRSNLHRQAVTSWVDLHTNDNDIANSTFTHFQFAKNDASLIDRNPGELNLVERMHLNTYCANYSQEPDSSDLGTWRIPNQRETAVMRYLAGISNATSPNAGAYYLSCSTWPFPSSGQRMNQGHLEVIDFCTIGANPTKSSPNGQLSTNNLRVRCVRDTDSEGNFVGSSDFGNVLDFKFGDITGSDGNYTVKATMNENAVVTSVVMAGVTTNATHTGRNFSASASGISDLMFSVTWNITFNGRQYTYTKDYLVPGVKVPRMITNADLTKMSVGASKTIAIAAPVESEAQGYFLGYDNGPVSPLYPISGMNDLTVKSIQAAVDPVNHFILKKLSESTYSITSVSGNKSPNNDGGSVVWGDMVPFELEHRGQNSQTMPTGNQFRLKQGSVWLNAWSGDISQIRYNSGSGGTSVWVLFEINDLVESITLSQTSLELEVGAAAVTTSATLSATVLPVKATDKSLTWESSNPDVVTVSEGPATKSVVGSSVTVTAVGVGEATITATANDGSGVTATCTVTVTNAFVPVTSITLNETSKTLNSGGSFTLTATVAPDNATNKAVTWSSNSTGIATVSESGVVTGVAPGTATITATAADGSGVTATCTVTVKQPVTSITLNKTSATINNGASTTLTATVAPNNATDKTVTWSTSNAAYATVDNNGVVTGKARGTAVITATANDGSGVKATCNITVNQLVTSVTNSMPTKIMKSTTGNKFNLGMFITVKPDNANNKNVTYYSTNPNIATVDSNGIVTSRARGSTRIVITAADGSGKYATCEITVQSL